MGSNITFANPAFLYAALIVPLLVIYYIIAGRKRFATFRLSSLSFSDAIKPGFRIWLLHSLFALRMMLILLLVIIVARPQSTDRWENISSEGIDIIMAMDISGSMLARDFNPDRLEASKAVATQFISGRRTDRIGLVVFSGESFTQCPLTTDHAVLINLMREIKSGMIEDGTAIGLGLATAISRIKDSDAVSKVIILLTDGVNNMGDVAPVTAAEIAATFGIRVYTIGVGTHGTAPYPVQTPGGTMYQNMPVEIDEDVLMEIASMTGGKYFRATDNNSLSSIYEEIDQMERSKTDIEEFSMKHEEYLPFGIAAAILLFIEMLARKLFLRKYF